ncbi:MAG TPA: hypothetical protein VHX43_15965 [Xanthobacteraceae bacterium]|jgi:predicted transcriptional regulator|nr:hypothetical protein [Xanthobacteraceae bacterium]
MEYPVPTTPYLNRDTILISFLMPVTLALQLGTGGQATSEYNKLRYDFGAAAAGYYRGADDQKIVQSQTAANEIARILEVLKPSVSSLAKLMGVSRTAIYDWMSGKQISPVNAAKLDNFTKAADVITAVNLQMSPIVRNRKLPNGMTLFESIASGVDGEKAALSLVSLLRGEAERRNQLTSRFAGRKAAAGITDDAPAIFNE